MCFAGCPAHSYQPLPGHAQVADRPFRAGRVTAVAGIPGNAATYHMGTPGGGIWKTVDGGTVWTPISDAVAISSIGAVSVAQSNPNIVYFGTGDVSMVGGSVNMGNGVYKSTDAGKTWQHVGLDETEHIGNLWIDPHNPDIVPAETAAAGQRNPLPPAPRSHVLRSSRRPSRPTIAPPSIPWRLRRSSWAGTNKGIVQLRRDSGATWQSVCCSICLPPASATW